MKTRAILYFVASVAFFAGAIVAVTGSHRRGAWTGLAFGSYFAFMGVVKLRAWRAQRSPTA